MRDQSETDRRSDPGESRLRETVRMWRWLSAILILGASVFEAWREGSYVLLVAGPLLAIAYWAILPRLVRFSLGISAVQHRGRRPGRPV